MNQSLKTFCVFAATKHEWHNSVQNKLFRTFAVMALFLVAENAHAASQFGLARSRAATIKRAPIGTRVSHPRRLVIS